MTGPNPSGLCMCGCQTKTWIASKTSSKYGWVEGQPVAFLRGHHRRLSTPEYVVDPTTGCWISQRWRDKLGYSYLRVNGRLEGAARVYYKRYVGPIPEGLQIDHLCRNPPCVNPDHLEVVTPAENTRRGNSAKLTAADASAIRSSDESNAVLAVRFNVSKATVYGVRAGRTWREDATAVEDFEREQKVAA